MIQVKGPIYGLICANRVEPGLGFQPPTAAPLYLFSLFLPCRHCLPVAVKLLAAVVGGCGSITDLARFSCFLSIFLSMCYPIAKSKGCHRRHRSSAATTLPAPLSLPLTLRRVQGFRVWVLRTRERWGCGMRNRVNNPPNSLLFFFLFVLK